MRTYTSPLGLYVGDDITMRATSLTTEELSPFCLCKELKGMALARHMQTGIPFVLVPTSQRGIQRPNIACLTLCYYK